MLEVTLSISEIVNIDWHLYFSLTYLNFYSKFAPNKLHQFNDYKDCTYEFINYHH